MSADIEIKKISGCVISTYPLKIFGGKESLLLFFVISYLLFGALL